MLTSNPRPIRVGLAPSLCPSAPEVKYVFRTLLRLAGFPHEFVWATADSRELDIYYGPPSDSMRASVRIDWCRFHLPDVVSHEPCRLHKQEGMACIDFGEPQPGVRRHTDGSLQFASDIVFGSHWLLTGARETTYARDRWDNLHLRGRFLRESGILLRPIVSEYAVRLRSHFAALGHAPADIPWARPGGAAFAFTHDVDYPQMIRWIECLRLLGSRGPGALDSIRGVLNGSNHFWKFQDWMDFEQRLGARPTFYFLARKGSLVEYAMGTPDGFYDVRAPEFRTLFRQLADAGCEIGLHASYHAHRDAGKLQHEKGLLEEAAGTTVSGNRHHYWHLDPAAPFETLRRHEQAGLLYDSSLAFEFYPGFRRGICHPFRAYHPGERRELGTVQLPPAWMDDHFDRRLAENGIADPEACARGLLDAARATGGAIVVDYHARGMNGDFYPRYGPWLQEFLQRHADSTLNFATPKQLAEQYVELERRLDADSRDMATIEEAQRIGDARADYEVRRMRPEEIPAVARMHYEFFGVGEMHGHSIADFGPEFLEQVFYRLNQDNPYLFVDVAHYGGRMIGFSVYASDGQRVFRETLRRHFAAVCAALLRLGVRRPGAVLRRILGNLQFLATDSVPDTVKNVRGWYFLLGVTPEFRSREFKQQTGIWVTDELWEMMERTLREQGCKHFWGVIGAHNEPMNRHFLKHGTELVARGQVQGLMSNYYRKRLLPEGSAQ